MKEFDGGALPNRVPFINLAVGVLTLISPWVIHPSSSTALWDVTITGIVIGVVALIALSTPGRRSWPIINVLLGIWLLISITFVDNQLGMMWSNIVLGVMAIVTGLVSQSYEASSNRGPVRA